MTHELTGLPYEETKLTLPFLTGLSVGPHFLGPPLCCISWPAGSWGPEGPLSHVFPRWCWLKKHHLAGAERSAALIMTMLGSIQEGWTPGHWDRRNQLRPAPKPVLVVFVLTFLCLSLFFLVSSFIEESSALSFLSCHSWQPLSCPCVLTLLLLHSPFFKGSGKIFKGEKPLIFSEESPEPTGRVFVGLRAQPGLSVSLGKAGQHGWAAEHRAQWDMLCGFLGTARETVLLLCQASLYCRGPLAEVRQATRKAEKVFHSLIEKTPSWIQEMPVSSVHAQL